MITPGRELDVAVARMLGLSVVALDWPCGYDPESGCYNASGHRDNPASWYDERGPVVSYEPGGWPPYPVPCVGEECAGVDPVPAYSTDPAAALAALEQVAAGREWSVDLHTSAFAVGWYCTILDEQTREEYHGEGASLAEAVSRAICKAVQSVGDAPS